MNRRVISLFLLIFSISLSRAGAQSQITETAPWAIPGDEEATPVDWNLYMPCEFLGGNPLSLGIGAAFMDRTLDFQLQGAFSHFRWADHGQDGDSYDTYGFTLGGDISHHFTLFSGRFGAYGGLIYRYNHIENTEYTNFPDTHWAGFSVGAEWHKDERLTFYLENIWFMQNFYRDYWYATAAGGIKYWIK